MQVTISNINEIDFDKAQLIPAIVQHARSGVVLMQGFMNREALGETLTSNRVTFFSRSKGRLWTKGESSGNVLNLISAHTDCDRDSLLLLAEPSGPTCHLGSNSCFDSAAPELAFLASLQDVIAARKNADPETSYTASLFARDISRSCQKVGEEGVEVALAAMKGDREELTNESADLLFHLLVLLNRSGLSLGDVIACLAKRHQG